MDFSITILGSNSAAPAHGRNQTAQLVDWSKHVFLVDCGESTQFQLRKFKIKYSRIAHVFISHLHGDHYLGLMGLIATFHLNNRKEPLTIYGPKGLDEIITIQLKYSGTVLKFPLVFIPTSHQGKNLLLEISGLRVFSFPLQHRIPCTGFYFEEKYPQVKMKKEMVIKHKPGIDAIRTLLKGQDVKNIKGENIFEASDFCTIKPKRKYAYCSDTIFDTQLPDYFYGADLLYHESTFMEAEKHRAAVTKHSTASEAATIAKMAGVKQLLLGHYSARYADLDPLLQEAKQKFTASFLSEEGKTYVLK